MRTGRGGQRRRVRRQQRGRQQRRQHFFLLSEAKQKMLNEVKQTPAEQLALLSRTSGVQF